MRTELREKYDLLREIIASYEKVAVAYSGGVDSSLLVAVAHEVLGDNAFAVTVDAPLVPRREAERARKFCRMMGVRQLVVCPDVMGVDAVHRNAPNRCYVCKKTLFSGIISTARASGVEVVADGSNFDDLGDYRPGMTALKELAVASPLLDACFTKQDIRELSHELGLPTADVRSSACLATRFPYGDKLTEERLAMADAAEEFLLDLGFDQVRVRVHGDVARIEVPPLDFEGLMDPSCRHETIAALKRLGFAYVTLDLVGYRMGSMNETIDEQ